MGPVECETAKLPGMISEPLSIEPYLAFEIDAVEDKARAFALRSLRQREIQAVPPVLAWNVIEAGVSSPVPAARRGLSAQTGFDVTRSAC